MTATLHFVAFHVALAMAVAAAAIVTVSIATFLYYVGAYCAYRIQRLPFPGIALKRMPLIYAVPLLPLSAFDIALIVLAVLLLCNVIAVIRECRALLRLMDEHSADAAAIAMEAMR